MPASPTTTAEQVLILNTAFDVSGESGPLLETLDTFEAAPPWRRVSGDTAPLQVILVDDGGTVVETPRRVILASGNTLHLTAKADPADVDQALTLAFTQAGADGEEYYVANPGTLAVDDDIFNGDPEVTLKVDFQEKNSGGTILRQWRTNLILLWSTASGGTTSPLYYVGYNAQSPTAPQQAQARANIGGTTVGQAIFTLTNPSAVRWIRINADNTVTALSAADTRAALGAGTSSFDPASPGPIGDTTPGTGKFTDVQLGVGGTDTLIIADVATQIVQYRGDHKFGLSTQTIIDSQGFITSPSITAPLVKAETVAGLTLGDSTGAVVAVIGGDGSITPAGPSFDIGGSTRVREDLQVDGEVRATSFDFVTSDIFQSWTAGGTVIKTANGTTAATFGVANSTTWTFAGAVQAGSFNSTAGTVTANSVLYTFPGTTGTLALNTAASTTAPGLIKLATQTEVFAAVSTSLGVTPQALMFLIMSPCMRPMPRGSNWTTITSGSGMGATLQDAGAQLRGVSSSTGGVAVLDSVNNNQLQQSRSRGRHRYALDFGKLIWMSFRILTDSDFWNANAVWRVTLGKPSTGTGSGIGVLGRIGIGVRQSGAGALDIIHYTSGSETVTASTFTPTYGQAYDVDLISLGNGTIYLYVNGTLYGTPSGGPTSVLSDATGGVCTQVEVEQVTSFVSPQAILYFGSGSTFVAP